MSIFKRNPVLVTAAIVALLGLSTSCDSGADENLGVNASTSDCGGFAGGFEEADDNETNGPAKGPEDETDEEETSQECGDETLTWNYDLGTQTVAFTNQNIFLNCCGDHSIKVFFDEDDETYEIAETDEPGFDGARCGCMCMFDFYVELPDVAEEVIDVKLTRHVTDQDEPRYLVWDGPIDLSEGSGTILIQEDAGWCD